MDNVTDFYSTYYKNLLDSHDLPEEITYRYEICACLKQTELKQVYLIKDKNDHKKYILKAVLSQSRECLEDEYILLKYLSHRGLLTAQEFIRGNKCNYLIREYLEGNTITELVEMEKEGHLSDERLITITLQLCDILSYLHSQNPPVIHRDIKSDNVILATQGECKLIDFGIAQRLTEMSRTDTAIMGTKYSTPPEQFGFKQTDERSDIYSIGILMYYMATGNVDLRDLEAYDISGNIKQCILKCTQFSPEDRFASVKQLKAKLKNAISKKIRCIRYISAFAILLFTILIGGSRFLKAEPETELAANVGQKDWTNPATTLQQELEVIKETEDQEEPAKEKTTQKEISQNVTNPTVSVQGVADEKPEDITSREEIAVGMTEQEKPTDKLTEQEAKTQGMADQDEIQLGENVQGDETQEQTAKVQIAQVQITQQETVPSYKNTPYQFTYPVIEEAVKQELGKAATDIVTYADLEQVRELYICGQQVYQDWNEHFVYGASQYMNVAKYAGSGLYNQQGSIENLDDISKMKNLQILALYNQKISDLSPITNLTKLTCLGMGANCIDDITPLQELTHLTTLDLSGNYLNNEDMSVLQKLPYLESLDLGDTEITELSAIKNIKLKSLSIFNDRVQDCDGIESMTSLEKLITTGVNNTITKEGLGRIASLQNLKELRLMGNLSDDVSVLTKMKSLEYLDLCACQIESLDDLRGLNLTTLFIDETPVTDISAIKEFPDLRSIGMRNIPCKDYTPISDLSDLTWIGCNKEQKEEIENQLKETTFQIYVH